MYDLSARLELEELLSYERFMLRECVEAFRRFKSVCAPVAIIVNRLYQ
jgi:hypothetical protein